MGLVSGGCWGMAWLEKTLPEAFSRVVLAPHRLVPRVWRFHPFFIASTLWSLARSCIGVVRCLWRSLGLSQRSSFESDAVRAVENAIADSVCLVWVANRFVPLLERNLGRDECGATLGRGLR